MKGNLIYDVKIFSRMGLIIGALEDATAFCTTVASIRNTKTSVLPFAGVVVAAVVAATAHSLQQSQNQT